MNELLIHTDNEKREIGELTEILIQNIEGGILSEAYTYIKERTVNAIAEGKIMRDALGFSPVITDMQTAVLVGHEIGFQNEIITSILLNRCVNAGTATRFIYAVYIIIIPKLLKDCSRKLHRSVSQY